MLEIPSELRSPPIDLAVDGHPIELDQCMSNPWRRSLAIRACEMSSPSSQADPGPGTRRQRWRRDLAVQAPRAKWSGSQCRRETATRDPSADGSATGRSKRLIIGCERRR